MTTTVPAAIATKEFSRGMRVLAVAQLSYVAWFGVCVGVALARSAQFAGHLYIPYHGDPYTESVDIWTGWSAGFKTPMMITAVFLPFLSVASIALSTTMLLQKRAREKRSRYVTLLVSTLLVLATLVLANLSAGRSIGGWILD